MKDLLFEIHTQEIPAGYIKPALNSLSVHLCEKLTNLRIKFQDVKVSGTPRRLCIIIKNVSDKQEPISKEILGPPKRIGIDDNGNFTIAGKKFAEKAKTTLENIKIKDTKKGQYLCAIIKDAGNPTKTLLAQLLPEVILQIHFPKTMKWSDLKIQFARPIISIAALFGNDVVDFQLESIKSDRYTYGHSFMHNEKIEIIDSSKYIQLLKKAFVIVDIDERKKIIENEVTIAAKKLGGKILFDNELLDTVTNLVEYPVISYGKFDDEFLDLPKEILINAMKEHQKYFALLDDKDALLPYFIVVNNTQAKDMLLVSRGHEKVLRARLKDAQFFYNCDLKDTNANRNEKLKKVLFQKKLGSVHDKVMRVRTLAGKIAQLITDDSNLITQLDQAALLCKSDLTSQVVNEFPKLQGIMGQIYAEIENETKEVSSAIKEHYMPTYSGGPLCETQIGSILSIADKLDTISGCFSIGLIPTGASDQYALRRQSIGLIYIILKNNFNISLKDIIKISVKLYEKVVEGDNTEIDNTDKTINTIYDFFKNRMLNLLVEDGLSKDIVTAVLSTSEDKVCDVWKKGKALEKLKNDPNFEKLAVTFKRVVNIIKKSSIKDSICFQIDQSLFEHESEKNLSSYFNELKIKVTDKYKNGLFYEALIDIAALRNSVDAFFDNVLVMAKEKNIQNNRLLLLKNISDFFELFADFSKISTK